MPPKVPSLDRPTASQAAARMGMSACQPKAVIRQVML